MSRTPADYHVAKEQAAIEQAKLQGFEIVQGDAFTLLLDLDNPNQRRQFSEMRAMVDFHFQILNEESWESKSGSGRKHVKLLLGKSLGPAERMALQAILGSDPKRECFGIAKLASGIKAESLLFKPPQKGQK